MSAGKPITVVFSKKSLSDPGNVWVKMEQEFKEEVPAKFNDLYSMLGMAKSGISSYTYVSDACEYAVVDGDTIVVSLDFYVWPSSLSVPYTLSTGLGTITEAVTVELDRSFDVIFSGSDSMELPSVFSGLVTPDMEFLDSDGSTIPNVGITVNESSLELSNSCYTVLRLDGVVQGFKHTLVMELTKYDETLSDKFLVTHISLTGGEYNSTSYKIVCTDNAEVTSWLITFTSDTQFNLVDSVGAIVSFGDITTDLVTTDFTILAAGWGGTWEAGNTLRFDVVENKKPNTSGYKIENLHTSVIASWEDERNGTRTETLDIKIPQCVEDMLESCDDGTPKSIIGCLGHCKKENFVVYFNTCDGSVLAARWE